jgi:hypothetical protein
VWWVEAHTELWVTCYRPVCDFHHSGASFFMETDRFRILTNDCSGGVSFLVDKNISSLRVGLIIKLENIRDVVCIEGLIDRIENHQYFENDNKQATVLEAISLHEEGSLDFFYISGKRYANRYAVSNGLPRPFPDIPDYEDSPPIKNEKRVVVDHLYIIQNTVSNAYKIGRSKNPKKRLSTLNISSDHPLILVKTYTKMGFMEKEIHSIFSSKKLNTEWFALCEFDLQGIDNLINTAI